MGEAGDEGETGPSHGGGGSSQSGGEGGRRARRRSQTAAVTQPLSADPPQASPLLKWSAAAFVYWMLFMGALTPGALVGSGAEPDWGREALRLTVCGLLGASVTPVLLMLARRFPVGAAGRRVWNLAIQAGALAVLSPALILVSCFLSAWLLEGRPAPTVSQVWAQLLADSLLLVFCMALFLALVQVVGRARPAPSAATVSDRLTIEERGRIAVIDLAEVSWIEAQGNYQALHGLGAPRLVRETSANLEARLPAGRFVRIHRRTLVAVDRIRAITPLANGDATVTLADGAALRMSRSFRETVRRRVAEASGPNDRA